MAAMNFESIPPIGALLDEASPPTGVALAYYDENESGNVTAGQLVGLELSFAVDMTIAQGEIFGVALPGFAGVDSELCSERRSLVESVWFERASWNVSSSILSLTASSDIPRGALATVNVPRSFALVIPLNGLEENHLAIRMGGEFVAGNVMMTSISTSPSVYVLTNRSLLFSPPQLGVDVSIEIRFRHSARLRPLRTGEILSFLVPGLSSSKALDDAVTMQGTHPFAQAHWDPVRQRLYLHVGRDVDGETVQVVIPNSEGFRLSTGGFAANDAYVLLDENIGPSLPSCLTSAPIGFFGEDAQISFTGEKVVQDILYAGSPVGIQISFTPSMDVQGTEKIFIFLQNFNGQNGSVLTDDVRGSDAFNVSWSLERLTLEVKPNATLRAHQQVHLQILVGAALKLPFQGLQFNDKTIRISSDAVMGPVLPTHLTCTQSVGSFTDTPSLLFSSMARPGLASSFTVAFTAQMNLAPGDSISIRLESHLGLDSIIPVISGASQKFFQVSYTRQTLALDVKKQVQALTPVEIIIPESAGIAPPPTGLPRNWEAILISATAAAGLVRPTPVTTVREVGKFAKFDLMMNPRRPGDRSTLVLFTQYALPFLQGDELVLHLTNFTENASQTVAVLITRAIGFVWQWHSFDRFLVATCTNRSCDSTLNVTVEGLNVPEGGLLVNDPRLILHAVDMKGSGIVAPTSVINSPAVGFERSAVSFSEANSGRPTDITLFFRSTFMVTQGSAVHLLLSGFSLMTSAVELKGFNASLFSSSILWMNSSLLLTLAPGVSIPAFSDVELRIDATFQLPTAGIPANDERIKISIANGLDLYTEPVLSVEAFPGFQEAGLSFQSDIVDLSLIFRHTTMLETGSVVEMYLPGFAFRSPTSDPIKDVFVTSNVFNSKALWHAAGKQAETLLVTLRKDVLAMQLVEAKISQLSLFNISRFAARAPTIHVVDSKGSFALLSTSGIPLHRLRHLLSMEWEGQLTMQKSMRDRSQTVIQTATKSQSANNELPSSYLSDSKYEIDKGAYSDVQMQAQENTHLFDSDQYYLLSAQLGASVARSVIMQAQHHASAKHQQEEISSKEDRIARIRQAVAAGECQIMRNSSIRYTPADVSQPITVTIDFEFASPDFEAITNLRLRLPQLTRPASSLICLQANPIECRDTLLLSETSYWSTGRWDERSKILEVFSTGNTAWASQNIILPTSAGFELTKQGVERSRIDIAFLFSVSVNDPDCELPISDSPAVGSFLGMSLKFKSGYPGVISDLLLQWIAAMSFQEGESINIFLPSISSPDFQMQQPLEFVCRSAVPGALSGNTSIVFNDASISWQQVSSLMVLTFSKPVAARSSCRMLIGQLTVPQEGFSSGIISGFTVSTNAANGPVGQTLIAGVIGIGAIYRTSLKYSSSQGTETNLEANFSAQMSLTAGDVITLHLPTFGGSSSGCVRILQGNSQPRGAIVSVGWSLETQELTLTMARFFPKDTRIVVNIPRDAGLLLPTVGLASNQVELTIRADAAAATASAMPILESDPIGSFLTSPKLSYDPPIAGLPSSLTLSFTPQVSLLLTLLLFSLTHPLALSFSPTLLRLLAYSLAHSLSLALVFCTLFLSIFVYVPTPPSLARARSLSPPPHRSYPPSLTESLFFFLSWILSLARLLSLSLSLFKQMDILAGETITLVLEDFRHRKDDSG